MGRGYDTLLFAKNGYSTVGLEISGSAVREAKKWVGTQLATLTKAEKQDYAPIELVLADFFDDEWLKMVGLPQRGGFDAIYDYAVGHPSLIPTIHSPLTPTQFLVAMNPSLRTAWAKRMAELIKPGTGLLICLEYPLFRPAETGGPPHGIKSEDYERLLSDKFEKVMHYMPERTHEVGMGSDMVGVWRRKVEAKL